MFLFHNVYLILHYSIGFINNNLIISEFGLKNNHRPYITYVSILTNLIDIICNYYKQYNKNKLYKK